MIALARGGFYVGDTVAPNYNYQLLQINSNLNAIKWNMLSP